MPADEPVHLPDQDHARFAHLRSVANFSIALAYAP
jgi:hypothetical protein